MQHKHYFAALLCGALCLTGCLKNEESASVAEVRNGKAAELNSIAALNNAKAQAEVIRANAEATLKASEAALNNAKAMKEQAEAAKVQAEAEYQLIKNQLEQVEVEIKKVELEKEKINLLEKEAYLQQRLAEIEAKIAEAEKAKAQAEYDMAKIAKDLENLEAEIEQQAIKNEILLLQQQELYLQELKNMDQQEVAYANYLITQYTITLKKIAEAQENIIKAQIDIQRMESGMADSIDSYLKDAEKWNQKIAFYEAIKVAVEEYQTVTPEEKQEKLPTVIANVLDAQQNYADAIGANNYAEYELASVYGEIKNNTIFYDGFSSSAKNFLNVPFQGSRIASLRGPHKTTFDVDVKRDGTITWTPDRNDETIEPTILWAPQDEDFYLITYPKDAAAEYDEAGYKSFSVFDYDIRTSLIAATLDEKAFDVVFKAILDTAEVEINKTKKGITEEYNENKAELLDEKAEIENELAVSKAYVDARKAKFDAAEKKVKDANDAVEPAQKAYDEALQAFRVAAAGNTDIEDATAALFQANIALYGAQAALGDEDDEASDAENASAYAKLAQANRDLHNAVSVHRGETYEDEDGNEHPYGIHYRYRTVKFEDGHESEFSYEENVLAATARFERMIRNAEIKKAEFDEETGDIDDYQDQYDQYVEDYNDAKDAYETALSNYYDGITKYNDARIKAATKADDSKEAWKVGETFAKLYGGTYKDQTGADKEIDEEDCLKYIKDEAFDDMEKAEKNVDDAKATLDQKQAEIADAKKWVPAAKAAFAAWQEEVEEAEGVVTAAEAAVTVAADAVETAQTAVEDAFAAWLVAVQASGKNYNEVTKAQEAVTQAQEDVKTAQGELFALMMQYPWYYLNVWNLDKEFPYGNAYALAQTKAEIDDLDAEYKEDLDAETAKYKALEDKIQLVKDEIAALVAARPAYETELKNYDAAEKIAVETWYAKYDAFVELNFAQAEYEALTGAQVLWAAKVGNTTDGWTEEDLQLGFDFDAETLDEYGWDTAVSVNDIIAFCDSEIAKLEKKIEEGAESLAYGKDDNYGAAGTLAAIEKKKAEIAGYEAQIQIYTQIAEYYAELLGIEVTSDDTEEVPAE